MVVPVLDGTAACVLRVIQDIIVNLEWWVFSEYTDLVQPTDLKRIRLDRATYCFYVTTKLKTAAASCRDHFRGKNLLYAMGKNNV